MAAGADNPAERRGRVSLEIFWHGEVGPLACNCYVVGDPATKEAVVIDPGGDADAIAGAVSERGLTVTAIVATHAHFDHVLAAEQVRSKTGAPFHLHAGDKVLLDWLEESGRMFMGIETGPPPEIDTYPDEGDVLKAGDVVLQVIHTPGHSPGSISLAADTAVFSGDTLFAGSVGRTDLPGGDPQALVSSIKGKLFRMGDEFHEVPVYPGHGPATTFVRERRDNPFVGDHPGLWTP